MKCNCQRWFWGVIPLVILCWFAVQFERSRIEQDLAERAGQALTKSGYTWAVAAIEGRDVVLSGRAADEDEPGKASELLRGTWGVRLIDNRVDLLEQAENYIWAASRRGQRIQLTGYAPSLATRQVIIGVVRANFPGFEIVDRTRLARGVPPQDTWLAGVSFALRQLTSLRRGDVRLDGLNVTVTGEAEDLNEYRTVKTALAGGLPKAIKLANNLVAPPQRQSAYLDRPARRRSDHAVRATRPTRPPPPNCIGADQEHCPGLADRQSHAARRPARRKAGAARRRRACASC